MNTHIPTRPLALAVALVLASGAAMAQVAPIRSAYQYPSEAARGSGPAPVQVGNSPVWVSPYAKLGYGHDSNLTLADTNEISSDGWQLRAGFNADARGARSLFRFSVDANDVNYSDSSADNYTDILTSTSLDFAFSSRSFLQGYWKYSLGHDARGSTDRGVGTGVDKYSLSTPGFIYAYGAPSAKGRVEVYASQEMKRYRNNEATTATAERDTTEYGTAAYLRVSPRTSIVGEVRGTEIEYLLPSPNSGRERRYYAGVTWEATAATSGSVKLGRLERKLDGGQPRFTGPSWEAAVYWSPRSYSKFDLYTARFTTESSGLGDFIVSDATGVNWNHSWSSFVTTAAYARLQNDRYEGFDRDDDITTLGLKANYRFRRWMTLGAEYQFTQRDSSIPGNDYDKDIWLLSAEVSM